MDFASVRNRLAGLEGKAYWRSLEELSDSPEFNDYLHREFPVQASEFSDPAGRRTFLKLMGASLALAGVGACTRQPAQKLIPYVRQPEDLIPGRPMFFATSMPMGGYAYPLLAENHMGRPTKLEGNPEHPASLGATDLFGQASILNLYDPDRSRTIMSKGEVKTWSGFMAVLQNTLNTQRGIMGQGLRILTEPISSPSLVEQIQQLLTDFPEARWHQWDPVFGTVQGGTVDFTPIYALKDADVIVSLDADFLGAGAGQLRYSKDFGSRRKIGTPKDEQNRLYVAEPVPTITGAKAEHRIAVQAHSVHTLATAIAAAVGVAGVSAGSLPEHVAAFAKAAAADLMAHRGKCVVVAGDRQPAGVQILARAINEALGNAGHTVHYTTPITASPADGAASITELVTAMNEGKVDMLLIVDTNPVFTAPANLKFADALQRVTTRMHLGLYYDDTAQQCHWHVPAAHYLESWGDALAFDGTVTLMQPLIAPIYDGRSAIEVIASINGQLGRSSFELVQEYWQRAFEGSTTAKFNIKDRTGAPFATAAAFWRHALHDGFIASTSYLTEGAVVPPAPAIAAMPAAPAAPAGAFEIVFRPDPTVLDGRFGNNGWMQELPKPLSKLTWDNVAYLSFSTAEKLGVKNEDVIEIACEGRKIQMPVWVMPGTAENTVAVHFGYGQTKLGRVANGVGVDAYPLRSSSAPWFVSGATITKTGAKYVLASTQTHFNMEGRNPVRVVTAEEYAHEPKESVEKLGAEVPAKDMTLYTPFEYNGYKWGMAIDLNACTGCAVCIVACVAENNIAVIGKEQIKKAREMHWLRVDTYFEGSPDAPAMYSQPVPCMQCENAPCEQVCPVGATVHSDEGLNDMVYNRCVGTRYCSNNCPYKVRRFNFLLYSDFTTEEIKAQRNPDVTIRSRGVMEKCTYCTQRISHARIDAKTEGRDIKDGEIVTACQQACPSDAIVFGNLNDPNSQVSKLKAQERNYGLLEDLNTRPRTTYLAVVRNPNPALDKA
ncbi:MAG: TAT-variant-translocated molybdopterin oxidoreductase [Acidobacteria bacterium]|nr:TAT-variant-translocated molybdopterin oxidoreductase [Acidobacteriota bacterium]